MASRWRKGVTLLRAPVNSVAFALRRQLSWTRGLPELRNEDKAELFGGDPDAGALEQREGLLCARYDLAGLRAASTRADYRENLYLLEALERSFAGVDLPRGRGLRVLDVGARNWNYVFGLARFFAHGSASGGRRVELLGLELDGHGIYQDLHSRADHARAYVAQLDQSGVEYRVQDFLRFEDPEGGFDVVCLLFPFLTRYALLQWGLPLSCFRPDALLRQALAQLRPGGHLLVFNQTGAERDLLDSQLAGASCRMLARQRIDSALSPYAGATADRWATVLVKQAEGQQSIDNGPRRVSSPECSRDSSSTPIPEGALAGSPFPTQS